MGTVVAHLKHEAVGEFEIDPKRLPRHVAIIMDGNGRWAKSRGLPRVEGHRRGVGSVRATVEECCRLGIGQLTLFCLSAENWKRPKRELDALMTLLRKFLIDERPTLEKQAVRLSVIGRRDGLPDSVLREMDKTLALTASNQKMTLCLAINYGSRQEIVDAAKSLARRVKAGVLDPEDIDEATFDSSLYTAGMPEPDLLIRTAGERRISNYLLWQISYSEIVIVDEYWPDFNIERLHQSLREYAGRERRFGGL